MNTTKLIKNSWGTTIDFQAAVMAMDDEIREAVHADMAPCTEEEFFTEYCRRHAEKYGETFEWDKANPQV